MIYSKIIVILTICFLFSSCGNTEVEDLPENVKRAIARHSELVDLSETYSFGLNQHAPEIFHDSIYSIVHDQINSALLVATADEIWLEYKVSITQNNGGILDISTYENYDLGRHKRTTKKQWGMPTTKSDKNIYPSIRTNNSSKLLPIRRSTVHNYKIITDTHLKLDKAKVIECNSKSEIRVNGLLYILSVSTSEVIEN